MNERIAISVSSSLPQVGVGVPGGVVGAGVSAEYAVSGGIAGGMGGSGRDRPRISLLPPAASVTPTPSPTASDYQHVSAAARNPRVGLMPVQPDQYCSRTAATIVMAGDLQDTPPFKKIRLGQPPQLVQQLQPQSRCQSLSPADPACGIKQEQQQQQQHVVQLQQPLRIDTRVGAQSPWQKCLLLGTLTVTLFIGKFLKLYKSLTSRHTSWGQKCRDSFDIIIVQKQLIMSIILTSIDNFPKKTKNLYNLGLLNELEIFI